jgi:hypothetical protein
MRGAPELRHGTIGPLRSVHRGSWRGRLRALVPAGSGMAGAVALLMLLAPVASAHSLVSFSAPYSGVTKNYSTSVSTYGCGASASASSATIHLTTGDFVASGAAAGKACVGSYSYGSQYSSLSIAGPSFALGTSGWQTVTIKWQVSWHAEVALHVTPPVNNTTYSFGYASAYIYNWGYLIDATNGSYAYGNNSFFNSITSMYLYATGNNHSSGNDAWFSLSFPAFIAAGHWYSFNTGISGSAYVDVSPGNSGTASYNFGTHGNEADLVSLTVS